MAGWSGAGVFTKTYSWVSDAANGIKIRADRHDTNDTDFTNGINNCLTKDGQNSASSDLPMGNNIHTGVGNATVRTNYLAMGQFQDGGGIYVATTGTADTYVASLSPAITAYAAGQRFLININATNTGACTININAVGVAGLVKYGALALAADELVAGRLYTILYDGTNFQVLNPSPKPQIITGAHATAFTNEIPMNSDTIAKTADGDLNGVQYEFHYKYLWNSYADGQAAVNGGRGASAQADWDADKNIAAPNMQDYVAMGVSSAGLITTVGDTAGATTVAGAGTISATALSTSQIPSHTHLTIRNETVTNQGGSLGAGNSVARRDSTANDSAYWLSPGTTTANAGITSSAGSGSTHTHTHTGSATSVVQKSIGVYWYLRV